MSTSWGLRCLTCGTDSPTWLCNMTDPMQEFDENWDAVRAIESTLWLDIRIGCETHDEPTLSQFMHDHHNHGLVFRNEYGDTQPIPGRCTRMMSNGETCGMRHPPGVAIEGDTKRGDCASWRKIRFRQVESLHIHTGEEHTGEEHT